MEGRPTRSQSLSIKLEMLDGLGSEAPRDRHPYIPHIAGVDVCREQTETDEQLNRRRQRKERKEPLHT